MMRQVGWYDYGAKKWANIATVSHGLITYWTWVPRYMVKVDSTTGEIVPLTGTTDTTDVKFVDMANTWTGSDGSSMNSSELAASG